MTTPQVNPPLKILKVDLIGESLQTYREVHGLHPTRYPVILWLSRPPSSFEMAKMAQAGLCVDSADPLQVRVENTTLEEVQQSIPNLNAKLEAAVDAAHVAMSAAQAEDGRLIALADDINNQLASSP